MAEAHNPRDCAAHGRAPAASTNLLPKLLRLDLEQLTDWLLTAIIDYGSPKILDQASMPNPPYPPTAPSSLQQCRSVSAIDQARHGHRNPPRPHSAVGNVAVLKAWLTETLKRDSFMQFAQKEGLGSCSRSSSTSFPRQKPRRPRMLQRWLAH